MSLQCEPHCLQSNLVAEDLSSLDAALPVVDQPSRFLQAAVELIAVWHFGSSLSESKEQDAMDGLFRSRKLE